MGDEAKLILNPLRKGLDKRGLPYRRVEWTGRRGAPDLVVFLPGTLIWIETKAPGEEPRPSQIKELNLLTESGQQCLILDDPEQVEEILGMFDQYVMKFRELEAADEDKYSHEKGKTLQ